MSVSSLDTDHASIGAVYILTLGGGSNGRIEHVIKPIRNFSWREQHTLWKSTLSEDEREDAEMFYSSSLFISFLQSQKLITDVFYIEAELEDLDDDNT